MAQVHQAVTGDFRAFFDFRFVCQLIRARLGSYVLFAALFLAFAVVLENLKTIPTGGHRVAAGERLSALDPDSENRVSNTCLRPL